MLKFSIHKQYISDTVNLVLKNDIFYIVSNKSEEVYHCCAVTQKEKMLCQFMGSEGSTCQKHR